MNIFPLHPSPSSHPVPLSIHPMMPSHPINIFITLTRFRFEYDKRGNRSKIEDLVDFPLTHLDLGPLTLNPNVYVIISDLIICFYIGPYVARHHSKLLLCLSSPYFLFLFFRLQPNRSCCVRFIRSFKPSRWELRWWTLHSDCEE